MQIEQAGRLRGIVLLACRKIGRYRWAMFIASLLRSCCAPMLVASSSSHISILRSCSITRALGAVVRQTKPAATENGLLLAVPPRLLSDPSSKRFTYFTYLKLSRTRGR